MRRSKLIRAFMVLAVVSLVGAACSKSNTPTSGGSSPSRASVSPSESESEGGTMTIGTDTANNHGTKDISGQASFELEQDNFYFDPTVLKGTPGQQVKLELKNEGTALHNFTLQDQNIDQDVAAGQSGEVTVTFPQSGFLEFFCKYHKAMGMVGELSV
jgi:plastocyanin